MSELTLLHFLAKIDTFLLETLNQQKVI